MSVYQGNFTTYFSTWLNDNPIIVDGVIVHPNKDKVVKLFERMPSSNEMSFADRFIKRNYFKEIGSETYELFEMHLANSVYEVESLYAEKIRLQQEHITKLYDRFVSVTDSNEYSEESSDNRKMRDFYNPITVQFTENNSNIDSASTDENAYNKTSQETFNRTKMFSFLKTNPQVMEEVNKLDIMYEKALQYLDDLFMIVL